jgi:hypothetical protein
VPCHSTPFSLSSDRDNYIRINWNNIKEGGKANFEQIQTHISMFGTQYDYGSIMHYSRKAFAIDKRYDTIEPLKRARNMGQRNGEALSGILQLIIFRLPSDLCVCAIAGMTEGDIIRLNRMYKCKMPTATEHESSPSETGVESSNNAERDKQQQQQPKTLFGMLIFKIVGKN